MYTDGNGFPLAVKPSHLYGSTERMDVAEILAAIVEQACLYEPDVPVSKPKTRFRVKEPKEEPTESLKFPKEAHSNVESPKEALTSVNKVSVVASDLVRIKSYWITLFKAVGLSIWLV